MTVCIQIGVSSTEPFTGECYANAGGNLVRGSLGDSPYTPVIPTLFCVRFQHVFGTVFPVPLKSI